MSRRGRGRSGVEYHKLDPGLGGLVGGPRDAWDDSGARGGKRAGVDGGRSGDRAPATSPATYNDPGRLFFNTADALVPQDANGTQDVYEYEPAGVGSCSEAQQRLQRPLGRLRER